MKASLRQPIGRPPVVSRVPEILRRCAGRKVLHLGCADAPYTQARGDDLLHTQLAKVTAPENLWGVDSDAEGIRQLRKMGVEQVLHGDCESLCSELRKIDFDVVLAGEILEHVGNPTTFLHSVASVMTESTELILTTVNATAIKYWVQSPAGREKVHPDHNYYFSYHTVRQLLSRSGFECSEIIYYQDVVPGGVSGLIDRVLRLIVRSVPPWSDGVIGIARPRDTEG